MTKHTLRRARLALGLTQLQLAEALGTTRNTIARWENGRMAIRHERLVEARIEQLRREAAPTTHEAG